MRSSQEARGAFNWSFILSIPTAPARAGHSWLFGEAMKGVTGRVQPTEWSAPRRDFLDAKSNGRSLSASASPQGHIGMRVFVGLNGFERHDSLNPDCERYNQPSLPWCQLGNLGRQSLARSTSEENDARRQVAGPGKKRGPSPFFQYGRY